MQTRCDWAKGDLYIDYHDKEWGVPVFDDKKLFEFLVLEGAQAGLSWITILNRRNNYRLAFDEFDYTKIVCYDDQKIEQLLQNEGIIRNRLKIRSVVKNAIHFIEIQSKFGSFSNYIWQFVDGKPIINTFQSITELPATTKESDNMSKDLKKKGFSFVGSTICYAFMQAVGMVNDHLVTCFRYEEVQYNNS
ncbi:MAG: DNA-3-methyladenine glycosylase [Spirochaetes bacterium GWD1_27_9]|nr:MAG: DNA-3-methyladenine glycosylase [Spirochaetes bacterium GWC1_27_15]OHD43582.1 MAG: DNA-3-methyladenine glycosylase [Spirochaetes bacterium GWD1_27_9]